MSELMERIARFKASGDGNVIIDVIPYARFLGLGIECVSGRVTGRLPFSDHLVGNPAIPALHGGTTGALLESVAIFQLLWQAPTIVLPRTISITVQYLRAGRPHATFASAVITKQGRRVAVLRADAWQEDPARPIATANAHFLIADGPRATGAA